MHKSLIQIYFKEKLKAFKSNIHNPNLSKFINHFFSFRLSLCHCKGDKQDYKLVSELFCVAIAMFFFRAVFSMQTISFN